MTESSSLCEERPQLPGGGEDEAEVGGAGAHGPREVLRVVLHRHVERVALQLQDLKRETYVGYEKCFMHIYIRVRNCPSEVA